MQLRGPMHVPRTFQALLIGLVVALSAEGQAQQPPPRSLDTVQVTATRISSPLPRTARHLQVLDTLQVRTARVPR